MQKLNFKNLPGLITALDGWVGVGGGVVGNGGNLSFYALLIKKIRAL